MFFGSSLTERQKMIEKWTILNQSRDNGALHAAVQSALWANVPQDKLGVWRAKDPKDFTEIGTVINAAVQDGFKEFLYQSPYLQHASIDDLVRVWDLCRYFRDRSQSDTALHVLIDDNVYMRRLHRFSICHFNRLQHDMSQLQWFSNQRQKMPFSFAMLLTAEVEITQNHFTANLKNYYTGQLPEFAFKMLVHSGYGSRILLRHLLSRVSEYREGELWHFVCKTYTEPRNYFFTRTPLITEFSGRYHDRQMEHFTPQ